jgi:hypothetical protein
MNPELILMQDGASGHSAKETQVDLNEHGIYPIFWPAFSPDLNLIETVWDGTDELLALVREMPARCEAVVDAQGRCIKY